MPYPFRLRLFFLSTFLFLLHVSLTAPCQGQSAPLQKKRNVITASDYCDFLNHIAVTDAEFFYQEKQGSDALAASIVQQSISGDHSYSVIAGHESDPVLFVTQKSEAAYERWLGLSNNGKQEELEGGLEETSSDFLASNKINYSLNVPIASLALALPASTDHLLTKEHLEDAALVGLFLGFGSYHTGMFPDCFSAPGHEEGKAIIREKTEEERKAQDVLRSWEIQATHETRSTLFFRGSINDHQFQPEQVINQAYLNDIRDDGITRAKETLKNYLLTHQKNIDRLQLISHLRELHSARLKAEPMIGRANSFFQEEPKKIEVGDYLPEINIDVFLAKKGIEIFPYHRLGEGGFGVVYEASVNGKKGYVYKQEKKYRRLSFYSSNRDCQFERLGEFSTTRVPNIPNICDPIVAIVKVEKPNLKEEYWFLPTNKAKLFRLSLPEGSEVGIIGLLMKQVQGEELFEYLKKYYQFNSHSFAKTKHFKTIAYQLLQTLLALDSSNIVHRDIKPENMMYHQENRTLKLIDFGLSERLRKSNKGGDSRHWNQKISERKKLGGLGHVSPIVFKGGEYSSKSNFFSYATTLLEMINSYEFLHYIQERHQGEQQDSWGNIDCRRWLPKYLETVGESSKTAEVLKSNPLLREIIQLAFEISHEPSDARETAAKMNQLKNHAYFAEEAAR